jgi:hypothetical protein
MNMINRYRLCAVLVGVLGFPAISAWACSCAPGRLGFCQALPDIGNADRTIFVGRVMDLYPKSRDEMNLRVDEFYRTHRDLQDVVRAQQGTSGRRLGPATPAEVEFRKQMIEYVWAETLTPADLEKLRAVKDERELDRLGFDQRRRVRLEVLENFAGADVPQFTLYTALEGPACGYDFVEGEAYLIEAYKVPGSDTWEVSSCSRTRRLDQASQDLEVLRAWKAGQRLPGHISGQIINRSTSPNASNFQLRLLGGGQAIETTSDINGQFRFENLEPRVYQVQLVQSAVSRPADLTRAWCAMVIIPFGP